MNRQLKRVTLVMLVMFLTLFVSTSVIQVVQADELAQYPGNKRTVYDSYEVQRGAILVEGVPIALSVPSPDIYSFQRVYPDGTMWTPVTGYTNPILHSATGIEAAMNSVLSGTSASQFFSRLERIFSGQAPRGSNVALSLDAAAQRAAVEGLGELQGAVIAIEPATGRILAMASSPTFDANTLAAHDADEVLQAFGLLEADPARPLENRAIGGNLNPPGSTFKLVTTAAALSSGQYTPESMLPNPASYQLPQSSVVIRNASGTTCGPEPEVSIADALRLSCNIPFAELAVALGDERIREQAELFGFNETFEVPLTSTASSYPRALDDAQTALTGYGQGQVTATPLQIAMVSAGIANGGVVMDPRMVDAVIGPDLRVHEQSENVEWARALDPKLAEELSRMMVANVSSGVASGARIDGVEVAGKTGTAENGGKPYSLWFTGFAPASDPQIAVAVVIENGGGQGTAGSGNAIAAPIAKRVMEAVLNK
ncbi:MAG: penicillin-binding transpeptidase domain-containing protein [Microbacteriaceae bacterium]